MALFCTVCFGPVRPGLPSLFLLLLALHFLHMVNGG